MFPHDAILAKLYCLPKEPDKEKWLRALESGFLVQIPALPLTRCVALDSFFLHRGCNVKVKGDNVYNISNPVPVMQ